MFQSKPTAAQAAEAESAARVAGVLLAMETEPALGFRVTPLALRQIYQTQVRPVVVVRLGATRHNLTADEARLVARCVQWDNPSRRAGLLASLFTSAAADAEAMADQRTFTADGGTAVDSEAAA